MCVCGGGGGGGGMVSVMFYSDFTLTFSPLSV